MLSTTEINTLPFHIVRALCDAWACRNNTGFGDPGELGWIGEFDETSPDAGELQRRSGQLNV